jgi:hypothetical protein
MPPAPARGLTPQQMSGYAEMEAILTRYGLSSLMDWMKGQIIAGVPLPQLQIDLYQQPAFRERYWVIDRLVEQGRAPMSADQVLEAEEQWRNIAVAADLPPFMREGQYMQEALAHGNSVAEMQERVNEGFRKVNENPVVRAAFRQYYPTDGLLASVFIDENVPEPELMKMVHAAQFGGEGEMRGFGIDRGTAERYATLGITQEAAHQGFETLKASESLFNETISEKQNLIAEQEGLAAVFGTDATSSRVVQRRAQEREAAYAGSEEAAKTREGVVGLGGQKAH